MASQKPATATVDDYMASLPDDARLTLESLRSTVRSAVPAATELINYGGPTFRVGSPGKNLVAFGASRRHCSFYLMSSTVLNSFATEITGYDTSKGTIRFSFGEQLPAELVVRLVQARIAEITAG